MESFKQVTTTNEFIDGKMKMFNVGGQEILLVRIDGKYYATENRCPHMGGNLSQGSLQGTVVTCPRHHSQFDLADGHVVRWTDWNGIKLSMAKLLRAPRPLKTYEIKIEGDKILISAAKGTAGVS